MAFPGIQIMAATCRKCGTVFPAEMPTDVDARVWSAHMKTLCCQKCGANHRALSLDDRRPNHPGKIAAGREGNTDGRVPRLAGCAAVRFGP
jgi:hypothetical protein